MTCGGSSETTEDWLHQVLRARVTRTLYEPSILRAFLTSPDSAVIILEVVSTSVCVVANPLHALWKAVIILKISVRRQSQVLKQLTSSNCVQRPMTLSKEDVLSSGGNRLNCDPRRLCHDLLVSSNASSFPEMLLSPACDYCSPKIIPISVVLKSYDWYPVCAWGRTTATWLPLLNLLANICDSMLSLVLTLLLTCQALIQLYKVTLDSIRIVVDHDSSSFLWCICTAICYCFCGPHSWSGANIHWRYRQPPWPRFCIRYQH